MQIYDFASIKINGFIQKSHIITQNMSFYMTFLLNHCPTLTIENKQIPFYAYIGGDWHQKCWNCEVKEKKKTAG